MQQGQQSHPAESSGTTLYLSTVLLANPVFSVYSHRICPLFLPLSRHTDSICRLGLAATTIMQQLDRVTGIVNGEGLEPKGSGDMTTSSTNDTGE
jgi:hypothetical protein